MPVRSDISRLKISLTKKLIRWWSADTLTKIPLTIFVVTSLCFSLLMKPTLIFGTGGLIGASDLHTQYKSGPPYEGIWLKGDAHMHTNFSDGGPNTVDDRAEQARKNNLDFIIITDHVLPEMSIWGISSSDRKRIDAYYKAVLNAKAAYPDVIILWGFEWTADKKPHILVYGLTANEMEHLNSIGEDVQAVITAVHDASGVTFFAHPSWSGAVYSDLSVLENITGFEGFNYGSMDAFIEVGKEWDRLLMAGKHYVMIGNSDAHGDEKAGQWGATFVYAPNATEAGIIEGYKRGCVYFSESISSNGTWRPIFRLDFMVNNTWMGQTLLPPLETNEFTARLWINVSIVEGDSKIDTITVVHNGEAMHYFPSLESVNMALFLDIPKVRAPSYFRLVANNTAGKYTASNPVFLGEFVKSEDVIDWSSLVSVVLLIVLLVLGWRVIAVLVKTRKTNHTLGSKPDITRKRMRSPALTSG